MSKLYTRYLELKRENPNKMYLIKSGFFYIFIGEDAIEVSEFTGLKCIPLTEDIMKCGFPETARAKYLRILELTGKEIEIVYFKKEKKSESLHLTLSSLEKLETLDLDTITPIQALEYLSDIQRELNKLNQEN